MNNFKFRSHRGGFEESMSTVVEVSNIDELLAHINKSRRSNDEIHSVNLSYCAYDSRNGWDTYYVSIPGEGVVGFINGDPAKTDEARKEVWEESEAGKAAREKEKSSVSFQDILRSEVLKAWSINFPGMMPVIERMKKTEDALRKEETKRFKVGDMLTMPEEVFSYEVIKDTGGEFIHVKNQITGIDKAVKRKEVSPILDARISDTGKVLNAKTADIYAKTDEAPASGADRLNAGKLQWSLVDFTALEPMVRVLMKGAKKYSPENRKKGLSYTSILDSTMRHMTAFKAGENLDPETGEPHTAHMLCNLMFLAWEELNRKDLDNRKPDLK